ncbi:MAG: hypothetical protein IJT91_07690, partial [Clostridia bacterium]|nr:hypothetical protein [Clostridia bacterium]
MKKRIFSFILTLAVLLTAPFIHCFAEAIPQTATEFEQTVMTITDPEIVSKNYESLAASESLFLDSGYLIGNEYKYRKPNDASLFETDTATKSIKASACTDEFGNLWHPVRAIISYADGSETVTLTEGKGGFTYDGSEYTVSVVYEMYLSSGSEIQRILINAAYYLVRAISNASKIDESILEIELAASNTASLSSNENEALRSAMAPETRSALERLNSQLGSDRDGDGEPDGMLEISELLELYESAQSKTGYLMTHGKALGTEARAFFESISLIANDSGLLNTIETIGLADPERADKLEEALRCFRDLAEAIEGPALDNWTALDRSVFRDGMTADDYEDVDMLLQEVVDEYEREERTLEPHVEEIKDLLWADSAVISSSVQRRTLTVTVGVNAISPMSFDSAETVSLGSESIELVFDKGTSAADIYADLELLGTESELLGRFGQIYEINETNYERTSNSIPDVLNEDATYYVEYNPRSFSVTYDYDPDAAGLLPFGYNMTLAPSETAGKIFEYQINGFSYRQGEIFTVRGDTVVSRNEISPTGTNRLNVIVSDIYGDLLTPEEKAILSSTALDGKVYNIVSPTDADELVKITVTGPGHYHVTADTLPSGIEGMIWYPVSAKTVRPNGSVISSFSMENGEADFSTDESYDKVEVLYKLDVNEEHITKIGVLDLPDKLAKQAESDIANMDLLGSIYSLLSQFDSSMIGRIGIVARNLSEESQAAVKDLTANCIDKTTNSLYIYDQLKAYSEEGLAYLYKDGNISKIKTQIDYVRTDFRIIYEDPKFRELLVELIDEETADNYCRRLADILGVLDKIELSPANENILPDDNGYDSLIAAIEAAIGHTSDHSDAEDRQLYIKTTVSATAPDKASITLTVCMSDGKGNITASVSDKSIYPLGTEMTSGDVAALNDIALSLAVKLGVDTWHYTQHGLIDIAPGTLIEADYHFTINWKPNVYTVIITDENGQPVGELRFSYDFPTV